MGVLEKSCDVVEIIPRF